MISARFTYDLGVHLAKVGVLVVAVARAGEVRHGEPDAELRARLAACALEALRVLGVLGGEPREVAEHWVANGARTRRDAGGARPHSRAVGREPSGVTGHAGEPFVGPL